MSIHHQYLLGFIHSKRQDLKDWGQRELAESRFRTAIRQAYEMGASYDELVEASGLPKEKIVEVLAVDRPRDARPL